MKRLFPGPRYCPKCTKVVYSSYDSTYAGYSEEPIYLVKRINSNTKDWFWGCPNFPKCKYSENRPLTDKERKIKLVAWANSLEGPHF